MTGTTYPLENALNAKYEDKPFSVATSTLSYGVYEALITKRESKFITIGTKYAYQLAPFTITMRYQLTVNNVLILNLDKNQTVAQGVKVSLVQRPWHNDVFSNGICLGQSSDLLRKRIPLNDKAVHTIIGNFEVVEAVLANTEKPDSVVAGVGLRLGKTSSDRTSKRLNLHKTGGAIDVSIKH